jgi:hypothetical protein
MNFADYYNSMVKLLLERELTRDDGISSEQIEATEQKLSLRLPYALREYYRVAGNLDELNRCHNRLLRMEELEVEDGYLLFMEENQAVVLWGVKTAQLAKDDPEVWQGINSTPMEWYSEEMTVAEFLSKMFTWELGLGEEQENN